MTLVITQKCDACEVTRELPIRNRNISFSTLNDSLQAGGWRQVPDTQYDEHLCPKCVDSIVDAVKAYNKK